GVNAPKIESPLGSYGRMREQSKGKDTTIGHWEIAGVVSSKPLPTYPCGFPQEIIEEYKKRTGRGVLCNKVYSGTEVIKDYGLQHMQTGDLIVYTSADSVFQVAAHEAVVPIDELYRYCKIARELLQGEHAVGRIIARPFEGEYPNFKRTPRRHDYSLPPPRATMLDYIKAKGLDVLGVGKISDIFAGKGVTESYPIKNNSNGMEITLELADRDFKGLCFVNLVDFDMVYGHRNDVDGYAKAVADFDVQLAEFLTKMKTNDIVVITADHGCDPATPSTDHSREYVPLVVYGKKIKPNINLGTRESFADTAATVLQMLGVEGKTDGKSYLKEVSNGLRI
ncbi:MAG: phosphopentomutase, partial [Clostridia bacterium]|nr:phosphopentomutase [Clostridia bacterium]